MAHWERRAQCLDFLDWALICAARHALSPTTGAGRRTFAAAKPISLTVWVWAGASVSQAGYKAVQKTYKKQLGNVNLDITTFTGGDAGNAEKFSSSAVWPHDTA